MALFESIQPLFLNKPLIVAVNKVEHLTPSPNPSPNPDPKHKKELDALLAAAFA